MNVSDQIFDSLCELVEATSAAEVGEASGLSSSSISRWVIAHRAGETPGLQRKTLDALCKIEEISSAAADALNGHAKEDSATWANIAGKLSRIMSPAAGWTLARKLKAIDDLGEFDPEFAILQAVIDHDINVRKVTRRAIEIESAKTSKKKKPNRK